MKFDLVIDSNVELAETPIWDARIQSLYWTDLFSGDVHRYHPADGAEQVWKTNALIGSAIPCEDPGKLLVVIETGAHLLDLESGALTLLCDPENDNKKNRYNDSRVDAAGRILMSSVAKTYGTPDYTPDQRGGFYLLDTDHRTVRTIVADINQYNAIVWNRDNTKMFVVDTYNEALLAFDYDLAQGPVGAPKTVLSFRGAQGMPDGMSIDAQDNLYICHWSGRISVWDRQLRHIEDLPLPVEFACCTGFGGENFSDLYVATSKYCYNAQQLAKNPGAGGTFVAHTGIQGRPDHFFK